MDLGQRWAVFRSRFAKIWKERAGFWGTILGIAVLVWKGADAAGNMDFIAQHWATINTFMHGWGMLLGLCIAGALIAKAVHDTSGGTAQGTNVVTEPAPKPFQGKPVAVGTLDTSAPPPFPPPPRQIPAYEAEQKLKLIDRALAILRDDFPPNYKLTHQLEQNTWSTFKKRDRHDQYIADLMACRDRAVSNAKALEDIRQRHPEHRDIGDALQQPSEGNSVETVLGHYLVAFQHLSVHVKESAPSETVNVFMGPRNLALQETLRKFENWRNAAERRLVELRRAISS